MAIFRPFFLSLLYYALCIPQFCAIVSGQWRWSPRFGFLSSFLQLRLTGLLSIMRSILIVDDSPMIRRIVSQLVQEMGYRAICAENGLKGYELALMARPDLVIMDIEMPVMGGYEATKRIKADERIKAIPVLFFSTLGSEENFRQAEDLGAAGYLNKPICREELAQVIDRILGAD